MKHILVEGGDGLGKDSLIAGIRKNYRTENFVVRHFGKPPQKFPEGVNPLQYQFTCFSKEAELLNYFRQFEKDEYNYYENIMIWNRTHLGEYVYGQMFRDQDPEKLKKYIYEYELLNLLERDNTYLILLSASNPEFFLSKEDGHSLSKKINEKEKELKLFNDIYKLTSLDNKLKINVNIKNEFKSKEEVLSNVLDFIKPNN